MLHEVHRQLLEMHGVQHLIDILVPYASTYLYYSLNPYGGSANF